MKKITTIMVDNSPDSSENKYRITTEKDIVTAEKWAIWWKADCVYIRKNKGNVTAWIVKKAARE